MAYVNAVPGVPLATVALLITGALAAAAIVMETVLAGPVPTPLLALRDAV